MARPDCWQHESAVAVDALPEPPIGAARVLLDGPWRRFLLCLALVVGAWCLVSVVGAAGARADESAVPTSCDEARGHGPDGPAADGSWCHAPMPSPPASPVLDDASGSATPLSLGAAAIPAGPPVPPQPLDASEDAVPSHAGPPDDAPVEERTDPPGNASGDPPFTESPASDPEGRDTPPPFPEDTATTGHDGSSEGATGHAHGSVAADLSDPVTAPATPTEPACVAGDPATRADAQPGGGAIGAPADLATGLPPGCTTPEATAPGPDASTGNPPLEATTAGAVPAVVSPPVDPTVIVLPSVDLAPPEPVGSAEDVGPASDSTTGSRLTGIDVDGTVSSAASDVAATAPGGHPPGGPPSAPHSPVGAPAGQGAAASASQGGHSSTSKAVLPSFDDFIDVSDALQQPRGHAPQLLDGAEAPPVGPD